MPSADVLQPSQYLAYNAPGKIGNGNVSYYYFDYDQGTGGWKGSAALAENTDGTLTFWMYDANFAASSTVYSETVQFTWGSTNGANITNTQSGRTYFVINTGTDNVLGRYNNNATTPYPGIGGTRFNPVCQSVNVGGAIAFRTVLTPLGGKGGVIRLLDIHHYENGHNANQLLSDNPPFGYPDFILLGVVQKASLISVTPSSANILTNVTLIGKNITTKYTPYFNSMFHPSASYSLISSTQMTVKIPNITLGPVTIFLTDGFNVTNMLNMTITATILTAPYTPPVVVVIPPPPPPVIVKPYLLALSVIPAASTLTEGQNTTFSSVGTYNDTTTRTMTAADGLVWTVANISGIGSIDPNSGFFVAAVAGTNVTVIASIGSITARATVTIAQRPIPPSQLLSLSVSPILPSVLLGDTVQFHASGIATIFADVNGQIVSSQQTVYPPVAWSVQNNTGKGTIDSYGLFTATDLRSGLDAKFWNGNSNSYLPPGGTGEIPRTPDQTVILSNINLGASYNPLPTTIDTSYIYVRMSGYIIPPVSGLYTIGLNSSNGANLFINQQGLIYDLHNVHISAGNGIYTKSSTINFVANIRYPIVIEWQESTNPPILQLLWTPPNSSITLVPSNALEGDTGSGATCTVSAESSAIIGTQVVTITGEAPPSSPPSTLIGIKVSPKTIVITSGLTQSFLASGYDQYDNILSVGVTWSISNGSGAGTIDPVSGLFYGEIAGTGITITATTNDISAFQDTASVVVIAGPISRISLSPPSVILKIGFSQQFTVTGYDSYGNAKVIGGIQWGIVGGIGTTDNNGFFTAVSSGVGKIIAYVGSLQGSSTINVQQVIGGVTIINKPQVPFARIHLKNTVDTPLIIDTRRRGGGIRSANTIDISDDFWWDLSAFDGQAFPMYGVFATHVYLPTTTISDPITTKQLIQNVFDKYKAPQFIGLITPDSSLPQNLDLL